MPTTKERQQAVDLAMSQIERQFGKGAIMRLGSDATIPDTPIIPTGSLSLDVALGIGGVPRGRVVEIFGPESSGKTTLALHIVAEAQKRGGIASFVDAEHALDLSYARKLGINVDDLLISQPDTGEQALEITEVLVRSGAMDAVVIDSVAALVPRAEIEGEMGDAHMGLQARLMSQALRKLTAAISKSRTTVIFINQIRMKIGVLFGNPETTTGGNALKFYASVRLDIRRISAIKDGQESIREGDILDMATALDIVDKSGAWYSYAGERMGQGREHVKTFLSEHPDICSDIENKVREAYGLKLSGNGDEESTDPAMVMRSLRKNENCRTEKSFPRILQGQPTYHSEEFLAGPP
ncbi:MAG: recombinase RecA [Deltaproteobacteria bacterium]|nr:recombinase RecA [Deltaproteobacteria bacterium]